MNIYYGESTGKTDVPAKNPVETSLDTALGIFRSLDPRRGFIGIQLGERFKLQLLSKKNGMYSVELLDTSIPAWDKADVDPDLAESLIHAAFSGEVIENFKAAREMLGRMKQFESGNIIDLL
jgi:hypothetical protein